MISVFYILLQASKQREHPADVLFVLKADPLNRYMYAAVHPFRENLHVPLCTKIVRVLQLTRRAGCTIIDSETRTSVLEGVKNSLHKM